MNNPSTVRIKDPKNPSDYLIIDEATFDPATMELWVEKGQSAAPQRAVPEPPKETGNQTAAYESEGSVAESSGAGGSRRGGAAKGR